MMMMLHHHYDVFFFFFLLIATTTVLHVDGLGVNDFPKSLTLRAAFLTSKSFLGQVTDDGQFVGFSFEWLQIIKELAQEDGVNLTVALTEESPRSSSSSSSSSGASLDHWFYKYNLNRIADDCGTTMNPIPEAECDKYDMVIGDVYPTADRSLRVAFTPHYAETGPAVVKLVHAEEGDDDSDDNDDIHKAVAFEVTTLMEADQVRARVCQKLYAADITATGSTYTEGLLQQVQQTYPRIVPVYCANEQDCLGKLQSGACALWYAEDELDVRWLVQNLTDFEVTGERFYRQPLAWAMQKRLPTVVKEMVVKWMYGAYNSPQGLALRAKHFKSTLCPLGKAGQNCTLPCDAKHGRSNRRGICMCDSARWEGADCSMEVMEERNNLPKSVVLLGYSLVALNLFAIFICATWLRIKWKSPQVQASQPHFLSLVLLGCLISSSTILPLALADDRVLEDERAASIACATIPWLYSVGFSVTFGALFAKIRRAYILISSATNLARREVSKRKTLITIGFILVLDITILTTWTIVDPLHYRRYTLKQDKLGYSLESVGYCTSDHWKIFTGVIGGLHLTLLLVAAGMCYMARHIPSRFSIGNSLAAAIVSNIQIFIVGVPVLLIVGSVNSASNFIVRSMIVWMNDLAVVLIIFGNLIHSLWRDEYSGADGRRVLTDAIRSYTSFVRRRDIEESMRESRRQEQKEERRSKSLSKSLNGVSEERSADAMSHDFSHTTQPASGFREDQIEDPLVSTDSVTGQQEAVGGERIEDPVVSNDSATPQPASATERMTDAIIEERPENPVISNDSATTQPASATH